jgi:CheY-like chemotaxis protein
VEVEVKGTASAPGTVRLTIAVCDTGPGIAPEQQQRIFEKFTQADGAVSRRFGGTGLGLAICREITRLMGGTIGVDSAPGYGSRFWVVVEMPVGPGECLGEPSTEVVLALAATTPPVPAPLHAVAHGAGQGLRVLVAEDHAVNRELAATMLQKLGCVVYLASDGSDALTVHESLPVDLIFMDCHMPVMDGFAATAAIRAREAGTGRHVPIVALTASAMHEDRLRCTEAGMDEFLSKPVQLADFATILEAVAARKDAVTLEWHSVAQSA